MGNYRFDHPATEFSTHMNKTNLINSTIPINCYETRLAAAVFHKLSFEADWTSVSYHAGGFFSEVFLLVEVYWGWTGRQGLLLRHCCCHQARPDSRAKRKSSDSSKEGLWRPSKPCYPIILHFKMDPEPQSIFPILCELGLGRDERHTEFTHMQLCTRLLHRHTDMTETTVVCCSGHSYKQVLFRVELSLLPLSL